MKVKCVGGYFVFVFDSKHLIQHHEAPPEPGDKLKKMQMDPLMFYWLEPYFQWPLFQVQWSNFLKLTCHVVPGGTLEGKHRYSQAVAGPKNLNNEPQHSHFFSPK